MQHHIFNWALRKRFETGATLNKADLVREMSKSGLYNVNSEATYNRRASTIISWIDWIIGLIDE